MRSGSKRVNWDYSMESAHEQFLFTSCNASKKNELASAATSQ